MALHRAIRPILQLFQFVDEGLRVPLASQGFTRVRENDLRGR